jgi:hypothetical protein
MKRNGNNAVNKAYNPKNKKPDMPLDADEVDSAMERFIRKKYQEKSLADGKPEPPRRDEPSPTTYSSRPPLQDPESPPPPVPSKKGKIFGFGLRASSSAYPFSKSDKKKRAQEPRVDSAFPISTSGFDSRMDDARYEMTEPEIQQKLAALRDMGFTETERNTSLLRRLNGNVERVVETLVRLGPRETGEALPRPTQRSTSAQEPATGAKATEPSYNPFLPQISQPTVGLSLGKPPEPSTPTSTTTYGSNNPYSQPERSSAGLEQSFQSLQVSQQPQQPLFPNSTGGYANQPSQAQDPRFQYSMTPPVAPTQYQGFVASPAAVPVTSNPFFQNTSVSAHSTGSNPFLPQPTQVPASPSNPFLNPGVAQPAQMPQRQVSLPASFNPFGIPPSQQSPIQQQPPQAAFQQNDPFGTAPQESQYQPNNPFQPQPMQQQAQPQMSGYQTAQSPSPFPNFQYGQPQPQVQTQSQPQTQGQMPQYQQQAQGQVSQFQTQNPYQQQQPQQLQNQQTGRYDKNSILALYNYANIVTQPLASIPEPASEQQSLQQQSPQPAQFQQPISPAPGNPFGALSSPKRSATLPVSLSSMHSAGGSGNRNPFMPNTNANAIAQNGNANMNPFGGGTSPFASAPPQTQTQPQMQSPFGPIQAQSPPAAYQSNPFGQIQEVGHGFVQGGGMPGSMTNYNQGQISAVQQRPVQGQMPGHPMGIVAAHTSRDSMLVNNLDGGRHSPDAFANLSARYG